MSGSVAELKIDLAVLAGLGAVLAVARGLMCLVVDFSPKGVCKLLRAAPLLLAQKVTVAEVLPQE